MNNEWIDLSEPWNKLRDLAKQRDRQKTKYKSDKSWSKYSTHFIGLLGEFIFAKLTGTKLDSSLRAQGDSGYDFVIDGKTYSIKTTRYWKDPFLKEYERPKKWCDIYVLIGVDMDKKRGKIFGWCEKSDMKNAKFVDFGYGKQRAISHKDLKSWNKK